MKRWITLLPVWGLLLIACETDKAPNPNPAELNSKALEAEVLSRVSALPEVQELSARIRDFSSGRASLELLFLKTPSDSTDFYRVAAAENSTGRFRPVYQFHVYPKRDWHLVYYDTKAGQERSLTDWRASLKQVKE